MFVLLLNETSEIKAYGYKSPRETSRSNQIKISLIKLSVCRSPGGREYKDASAIPPHSSHRVKG